MKLHLSQIKTELVLQLAKGNKDLRKRPTDPSDMGGTMFQVPGSSLEIHRSRNTVFPWTDSQGLPDANQTHERAGIVKAICSPPSLHLSWCLHTLDAPSMLDAQMKQIERNRKCIDLKQETFLSYFPKFPHLLFSFWKTMTSISSQDRVTETRFTLLPETATKMNKKYETTVFKTLDIRQGRMGTGSKWNELYG